MTRAVVTTHCNKVETLNQAIDKIEFYHENCDALVDDISYENRFPETLASFNAVKTQFHKFKVVAS